MAAKKSAAAVAPKGDTEKKKPAAPAAKKATAQPLTGDSKLAKFLTTQKLDPRRVLACSHHIESLRIEDRKIKLARKRARGGEDAEKKAEANKLKPRSGRPVTHRAMNAALTGGSLSGPTKSRILRAVNHLLENKKQEKVDLKALF
jgi:hypothetical protein